VSNPKKILNSTGKTENKRRNVKFLFLKTCRKWRICMAA